MNIKDFAHHYIGQRCLNTWFPEDHPNYNPGWVLTGFDRDAYRPFKLETEDDFTWWGIVFFRTTSDSRFEG